MFQLATETSKHGLRRPRQMWTAQAMRRGTTCCRPFAGLLPLATAILCIAGACDTTREPSKSSGGTSGHGSGGGPAGGSANTAAGGSAAGGAGGAVSTTGGGGGVVRDGSISGGAGGGGSGMGGAGGGQGGRGQGGAGTGGTPAGGSSADAGGRTGTGGGSPGTGGTGGTGGSGGTIPAVPCAPSAGTGTPTSISLDGNDVKAANVNGLTFKGFGVLSANGTSALLMDYKAEHPERYAELLEILFGGTNPIMTQVKIEMGNDRNNSTGPDPATMRLSSEAANVKRCPGFQLAADAKQLNPNLKVSILRWNAPGWVKSNDNVYTWYKNTILAAYRTYGYMVDYVNPGVNEQGPDFSWTKQYASRVKSDTAGFNSPAEQTLYSGIKVVISDEAGLGSFGDDMVSDASLRDAVAVAGYHYNTDDDAGGNFKKLAEQYDKEIWNSEAQATFSNSAFRPTSGAGIGGPNGPLEMGNTIIKGFVNSRRTHFIYQPAIGGFYEGGAVLVQGAAQCARPVVGMDPLRRRLARPPAFQLVRQGRLGEPGRHGGNLAGGAASQLHRRDRHQPGQRTQRHPQLHDPRRARQARFLHRLHERQRALAALQAQGGEHGVRGHPRPRAVGDPRGGRGRCLQ